MKLCSIILCILALLMAACSKNYTPWQRQALACVDELKTLLTEKKVPTHAQLMETKKKIAAFKADAGHPDITARLETIFEQIDGYVEMAYRNDDMPCWSSITIRPLRFDLNKWFFVDYCGPKLSS